MPLPGDRPAAERRGYLDEASQVAGVRTVARTAFPDGGKWRWLINGRPVFLRGANWAPADVLPGRVTDADYARLLGMARDAGINFLRVWGGGVREKRAFWETCDRLGIMAWQEFPLACAFLDHYPRDPAYLEALAGEGARDRPRPAQPPQPDRLVRRQRDQPGARTACRSRPWPPCWRRKTRLGPGFRPHPVTATCTSGRCGTASRRGLI